MTDEMLEVLVEHLCAEASYVMRDDIFYLIPHAKGVRYEDTGMGARVHAAAMERMRAGFRWRVKEALAAQSHEDDVDEAAE